MGIFLKMEREVEKLEDFLVRRDFLSIRKEEGVRGEV